MLKAAVQISKHQSSKQEAGLWVGESGREALHDGSEPLLTFGLCLLPRLSFLLGLLLAFGPEFKTEGIRDVLYGIVRSALGDLALNEKAVSS